jgi:AraC-like DNA-binding protein
MTVAEAASNSQPIPRVDIDTSVFPMEDRYDAWRDFDNVVSDIQPNAQGHRDPEALAVQWQLGDLTVAKKAYGPHQSSRRIADRKVKWNECLRLRLYEEGSVRGLYGETPTFLKAGDIHLTDLSVGFRTCTDHLQHITILFPYETIGYDPSRHPSQVLISNRTAQGRVLETAMRCLAEQMPTATTADARALAQGVTGLVRGMLLSDVPDAEARSHIEVAQQTAMRCYIDENLLDKDLDAATLSRVFHASRATVYRHFAEAGGVSRYVKERRLDCAFSELTAQPVTRGRIRAVAERCGFFEAGHFNRVFRQRFGLSPSEVAALGEIAPDPATLDAVCGTTLREKSGSGSDPA